MADYERDGNGAETEPSQRAPPHAPLGMWTLLEKNCRKSRAKALAHAHPASATASSATTQPQHSGALREPPGEWGGWPCLQTGAIRLGGGVVCTI